MRGSPKTSEEMAMRRSLSTTWLIGIAIVTHVTLSAPVMAQNITFGAVEGVVSDETGAVLPGVTVIAASPALQLRQVTMVTDSQGRYRFIELPPGTYSVRFELAGFQAVTREDLELAAGFTARVNMSMKVGSVGETVIVSGASPVVDLTNTRGGHNIDTDVISVALPGNKNMADLIEMTPGLHATDGWKNGAVGLSARPRFNMYGIDSGNTNVTIMVDGFSVIPNQNHEVANTEETDIKSYGNGAEVREAGTFMNLVTKSGGNEFHGRLAEAYMWQPSGNITPELEARGLRVGTELNYFNDASGDLGGRIVRDRLWFFTSGRYRVNESAFAGFQLNAGPDGQWHTGDEPAALPKASVSHIVAKGTAQLTQKYQVIADISRERTHKEADGQTQPFGIQGPDVAGFRNFAFEATNDFYWRPTRWKFEYRGTPTSTFLFDIQAGRSTYLLDYKRQPECGNRPGIYNRATVLRTGCGNLRQSDFVMWITSAVATFIPRGTFLGAHEVKFGYQSSMRDITGNGDSTGPLTSGFADYNLMFDTINGVPNTAAEFEYTNAPVRPDNWDNVYSAFVTDQWRVNDRLTFNLGTRVDHQHSWVPEQTRQAGQWVRAETFPRVEVGRWTSLAPRAAVAWDPTGSGKAVVKASYGWFNNSSDLSGDYNAFSQSATRFRWRDLNGNGDYDPGEVNLDLNGLDFISTTARANNEVNPDLKLSNTQEISVSYEREVAPGWGVRGLYLLKYVGNGSSDVNVARPFEAFDIPIQRRDPGPDGVLATADDGDMVTIYDYAPAFRGNAFVRNLRVNRPAGREDYYNSYEVSLVRRVRESWSLMGSYTATKYHRWIVSIPQSPNDEAFPLDEAWRWGFKLNGNYVLPGDISFGTIVEVVNGLLGQRTNVFRATDASGPPLRQLSSVTLRLEPWGAQKESAQVIFNLRGSRKIMVGRRNVNFAVDVLNVTNSSTALRVTYASGPAFRTVSDNTPPRVLRLGVTFDF
jgi:hypothetical protein